MNVYLAIKDLVEKETGMQVVLNEEHISEGAVFVNVQEIEKTNVKDQYRVSGIFEIKTGENYGWNVLKRFLDLNVTDSRASASMDREKEGFLRMEVDFSMILNAEEEYESTMKRVEVVK